MVDGYVEYVFISSWRWWDVGIELVEFEPWVLWCCVARSSVLVRLPDIRI